MKENEKIIHESPWLDGELAMLSDVDAEKVQRVFDALNDPRRVDDGRCLLCGAEQPDDVRWPQYAWSLKDKVTGEETDYPFTTCPKDEDTMDQIFADLARSQRVDR